MVLRKRVVVTGVGVLSSIGSSAAEFKRSLLVKQCGIRRSAKYLEQFENANASEVLDALQFPALPDDMQALLDRTTLWAYKVGSDALQDAKLLQHAALDSALLAIGLSSAATECFMPLMEHQSERFSWEQARACGTYGSVCSIISSLLGLKGGYELVATACTASTNAIGLGFDHLQSGPQSVALIIGTEPLYLPTFSGFYALKAMHEKSCSPFSGTPGMSIGEGAGAIVLEEYEHAKARGAAIYGEILSYATSSDAYHETAPDPRAQAAALVMNTALAKASLATADIDYINAHGTGTEANDRAETLAMKKVFANIHDIPVSSTKSYFGHNIGAAGILEFIACLAVLPEGLVLPTLNFGEPRIDCDLNYVPNDFQQRRVRIFMKNNYAFGGNNCSVIAALEPQLRPQTQFQPRQVAITGFGAIASLGCGMQQIIERIWQDEDGASIEHLHNESDSDSEKAELKEWLEASAKGQRILDKHAVDGTLRFTVRHHQIRELDARRRLKNFDGRKANKLATFGLLALENALADAALKLRRDNCDTALIMGMARGPQSTVQRLTQSMNPDPKRIRTLEFATALMNSCASFCSIAKGMKGYNTTLASGINASIGALCYGFELVRQQSQLRALVGGADEAFYGLLQWMQIVDGEISLDTGRESFQVYSSSQHGYLQGEGAAVACLEDAAAARERNATCGALIAGYGRSADAAFTPTNLLDASGSGMAAAIETALANASLDPGDIDLVCGTSWGLPAIDAKEAGAIRQVFGRRAGGVPIVNYNAHFGLVEAAAGLLNIGVLLEVMRRGEILPIAHTRQFCAGDLNFVRQRLVQPVRRALLLASSEGGNNYAVVLQKAVADG